MNSLDLIWAAGAFNIAWVSRSNIDFYEGLSISRTLGSFNTAWRFESNHRFLLGFGLPTSPRSIRNCMKFEWKCRFSFIFLWCSKISELWHMCFTTNFENKAHQTMFFTSVFENDQNLDTFSVKLCRGWTTLRVVNAQYILQKTMHDIWNYFSRQ